MITEIQKYSLFKFHAFSKGTNLFAPIFFTAASHHRRPSKREPRPPITKVALTTYKRGDSVQGSI